MAPFHRSTALMLIATLASTLGLEATDAPPGSQDNPYQIPFSAASIEIDGDLQEIAWRDALMVTLDYEVRPRDNAPANVRTEVFFTYDDSNLYVGFRCHDPEPSQIRAILRDRDTLGGDDWVAIEMDTYNDHRHAFTLFSTPLGVQADGLSDAAGVKDYSWDTIYDSAGMLTEQGYTVEMAIPFSSLRFQRTSGPQIWGINIVRGLTRNQRYQIWSAPYDRGNSCRVCQYLRFKGFEGVSPGRNIEINPTVTGTLTRARPELPDSGYETANRDADLGVTARWGMTPNLFLGATINPDFSQVEADALQLDINQPFALFFEERRPFFTDGSDFFQTGLDLIYTRTVRDPRWGVKLTGKQGDHAIGAFVTEDEVTNVLIPGAQSSDTTSLDEPNLSGAFRYSWDTWNNSDLGIILTSRKSAHYSNLVYGVTSLIRLGENDTITAELLGSSTEYDQETADAFAQPDDSISDFAFSLDYVHKTSHYTGELGVTEVGEEFRADLGFMPQVGYRRYSTQSIYEWRNSSDRSWWSSMRLLNTIYFEESTGPLLTQEAKAFQHVTGHTFAGSDPRMISFRHIPIEGSIKTMANGGEAVDDNLLEKGVATSFLYVGPLETSVFAGNITSRKVYNGIAFDLSQLDLSLSMVPTGNISFDISATFGDQIDFANTRKGERLNLSSNLSLNLGTHFDLSLSHTREEMDSAGDRLYQADISQATLIYSFSSRALLRSILQLVDYQYNTSNYSFPIEATHERLLTQLLFSYKVNPRTVLFAGYSDRSRSGLGYGLTRSDYTLFIKLGYALVL